MLRVLGRVRQQSMFTRIFDVTMINYATLFMNLVTGVLTARFLGPSQKGIYYAVNSWVDMIGYIAGLGINQAFVWYYNGECDKRRIFKRTLLIGLTTITLSGCVGEVLVWFPLHRLGHVAVVWAAISIAILPIGTMYGLCTTYLMVRGCTAEYNWLRVIQGVSSTAAITILACVHFLNLNSYLTCLCIISLLSSILCWVITFRKFREEIPTIHSYVPKIQQFMTKSIAYFVPSLSSLFNARLDQMICTLWLSQSDIGLYGVATSSLGVLGSVVGAFCMVFFPAMAQSDKSLIVNRGNKAFRLYLLMSFGALVCVVSLSPEILRVLYGSQYVAAYPIVLGLSPVAVFSGLISILYQGFFSMGKPYYATISEIVGAFSGAILIWILAPRFGGVGVSIANSISYALDFALCLYFWTKTGGKLKHLVPVWADLTDLWSTSRGRIRALFA